MFDNTFHRRKEIERMLLSGKKLTLSELMSFYGVSKSSIRRDFDIISEYLPVISKPGNGGGYFLVKGPGAYQNSLSQEQLRCLEELESCCKEEQKKILQSIIREFGPYQEWKD